MSLPPWRLSWSPLRPRLRLLASVSLPLDTASSRGRKASSSISQAKRWKAPGSARLFPKRNSSSRGLCSKLRDRNAAKLWARVARLRIQILM